MCSGELSARVQSYIHTNLHAGICRNDRRQLLHTSVHVTCKCFLCVCVRLVLPIPRANQACLCLLSAANATTKTSKYRRKINYFMDDHKNFILFTLQVPHATCHMPHTACWAWWTSAAVRRRGGAAVANTTLPGFAPHTTAGCWCAPFQAIKFPCALESDHRLPPPMCYSRSTCAVRPNRLCLSHVRFVLTTAFPQLFMLLFHVCFIPFSCGFALVVFSFYLFHLFWFSLPFSCKFNFQSDICTYPDS